MRQWFNRENDRLEHELRDARPEPRAEFVRELTGRLALPGRRLSGSRLAFSLSLAVFVLGSFAAFGGLGYASSGARSIVRTVVHPTKASQLHSSAAAQYTTKPLPKRSKVAGAIGSPGRTASRGTLPFTGISLAITAAIGLALLVAGLILRRRETRRARS